MLQSASEISPQSSNDKLAQKRPRSHYSEMNSSGQQQTLSTSGQKLDTSFESYFGVERSASNSDVVRIKVPYSRDDALSQLKKTNSQDMKNTNTTSTTTTSADQNKIRIRVPKNSDGTSSTEQQQQKRNKNSSNGNNGTLEHEFNSKISLKNHNRHHQQHHHANNSNSKSMTNL